jgi:hypothetical protein
MKKILLTAVASALLIGAGQNASAHIGYTGRNLGTWDLASGNWSVTGNSGNLSNSTVTINVTNISSDYGWADAADSDWGDSHRGRWFSLTVNTAGTFQISIIGGGTNSENNAGVYPYVSGTRLLPGFTIFKNLAVGSSHDGSHISMNWRRGLNHATEGSLNVLGNFSIGSDTGQIGELVYVGHAVDGTSSNYGAGAGIEGDGTADGSVSGIFTLEPGTYSVFVGGANYSGQNAYNIGTSNAMSGQEIVYPTSSGLADLVLEGGPAAPSFGASISFKAILVPQITSLLTANGIVGEDFAYQITASNNAEEFDAEGLPTGLSINSATGLISGTHSSQGNYFVTIYAINSEGGAGTATLQIAFLLPVPVINSPLSENGTVGAPFNYQIAGSNNPTSYGAIGLPDGLSVNSTTGIISGTPIKSGLFASTIIEVVFSCASFLEGL